MKTLKYIIISFLLSFTSSFACTCTEKPSLRKEIKSSDIILSGTVISKKLITEQVPNLKFVNREMEYTILVEAIYKGKVTSDTIKVITGIGNGDCGYIFKENEKYFIYANYTNQGSDFNHGLYFYYTSICTRTGLFDEIGEKNIKKYGRLLRRC